MLKLDRIVIAGLGFLFIAAAAAGLPAGPALLVSSDAESREAPDRAFKALVSPTLGAGLSSPRMVTPPGSYSLSIDGDFALGGFVFKGGQPFLHNDGGATYGNTAIGINALVSSSPGAPYSYSGRRNTAVGATALQSNTTGSGNTASGFYALWANTNGSYNTASGYRSLQFNTMGSGNAALGQNALWRNTEGNSNTAAGAGALQFNLTGSGNTAAGLAAMTSSTVGSDNTALGGLALAASLSGSENTAVGFQALFDLERTDGYAGGSRNIAIGTRAGENLEEGDDNIYIGSDSGSLVESGIIRVGTTSTHTATHVAGIHGTAVDDGTDLPVLVDSTGKLGTMVSSRRFKKEISPLGSSSSRLLELQPMTFRYKRNEAAENGAIQYGLIAEDVEAVFPELVVYDTDGKPYAVRYHQLAPILLNEVKRQQRQIEELASQSREVERLRARLKQLEEAVLMASRPQDIQPSLPDP